MLPAVLESTKSIFIVPAKLALGITDLDAAMGTDQLFRGLLICFPGDRYRQWLSIANRFEA